MKVGNFTLANEEKVERALRGTLVQGGKLVGGVGDGADDEALLAEYDRLGGLVLKDDIKVKTGSFYDLANKCPRKEPELSFLTTIDNEIIEVTEEEAKVVEATKEKIKGIKAKKEDAKPKKVKKVKKEEDYE